MRVSGKKKKGGGGGGGMGFYICVNIGKAKDMKTFRPIMTHADMLWNAKIIELKKLTSSFVYFI